MKLEFIVPGNPQGQGRPRFAKRGNFISTYDPEQSRDYKNFVKLIAIQELKKKAMDGVILPLEKPCELVIKAFFGIPKSAPKKLRKAVAEGGVYCDKKPDVDNIAKGIMDALNGIAYRDDKQICSLSIKKYYSENPRVEVELEGE